MYPLLPHILGPFVMCDNSPSKEDTKEQFFQWNFLSPTGFGGSAKCLQATVSNTWELSSPSPLEKRTFLTWFLQCWCWAPCVLPRFWATVCLALRSAIESILNAFSSHSTQGSHPPRVISVHTHIVVQSPSNCRMQNRQNFRLLCKYFLMLMKNSAATHLK